MPRPAARRRIGRQLFTLIAAASLGGCIAVCGLWARSYWVSDYLIWQDSKTAVVGGVGRGRVLVRWTREAAADGYIVPTPLRHSAERPARPVGDLRLYGAAERWHG